MWQKILIPIEDMVTVFDNTHIFNTGNGKLACQINLVVTVNDLEQLPILTRENQIL